jgi:outer membrane protein assembly factor BamB
MQKIKNRTMTTLITLILALTIAIPLFALPNANAASILQTFSFIGATPNPVGVGQSTLLHIGVTQQLSLVQYGWKGLTVTVTKPDGTTETLGPFTTDSTGGTGSVFIPSVVGNYTLQTHFPEQLMPTAVGGIPAGTRMLASDSKKLTLIVQEENIPYNPGIPLPTEFWTRPINGQFREWYTISGSSWMDNKYNDAPGSPHILWTKPLTIGGLVGGYFGLLGSGATSVGMENGDAYEGKFSSRLILAGRLYYNDGAYDRPAKTHCIDLRTGEELWTKTFLDNRTISFGQLYYFESYNYQGTFAYLWVTVGNTWTAFDSFTGEWIATVTDVPSGTRLEGPRGEIYIQTVDLVKGTMGLWNMSALVSMAGSWGSAFSLRTHNASATYANGTLTAAASRAWAWNVTIPKDLPGTVRAISFDDKIVGSYLATSTIYRSSEVGVSEVKIWALSLKKGQEGQVLYRTTWQAPVEWQNTTLTWSTTDLNVNIGIIFSKEECTHYAFNLENGQYLWKTEPMQYLSIYSVSRRIYEGNLYAAGMTGIVYCFSLTTGKTLWTRAIPDLYQAEILWSDNWPETIQFAEDGKLYLFHSEHSANQPLPRGAPTLCLNATTGEILWRVNGLFRKTDWGGSPIMGDSVIAMYNTYDQQVYAIGKGPSASSVEAPMNAVSLGESLVIRGTVRDVSPGTMQTDLILRFPNGVPAVSDDSQGEWMKYVYAQFPYPTTATGVPVSIDVIDSNGNYRNIGTTTSDSSGMFTYTWTPDIVGSYTVIATFEGSESYWPSNAESSFVVDQAPVTPAPTAEPMQSTADMYFVPAIAGLFVFVAIIGVVLALLVLRKRP